MTGSNSPQSCVGSGPSGSAGKLRPAFENPRTQAALLVEERPLGRLAADFACCESALWLVVFFGSRFNACLRAVLRRLDVLFALADFPRLISRSAFFFAVEVAFFWGGTGMPERRASLRPIAMACWGDRAPCLPCLTCSISSRTNSPAAVFGDFPSRSSRLAFFTVCFEGILLSLLALNFLPRAMLRSGTQMPAVVLWSVWPPPARAHQAARLVRRSCAP